MIVQFKLVQTLVKDQELNSEQNRLFDFNLAKILYFYGDIFKIKDVVQIFDFNKFEDKDL